MRIERSRLTAWMFVLLPFISPVAALGVQSNFHATIGAGTSSSNKVTARPTVTSLYAATRGRSNMTRLGGTASLQHGAVAISGTRQGPSSQINGREFPQAMGNR